MSIRKIRCQIWSRFFTQFWLLSLGSTPNPDQGDFCCPIPNVIPFSSIRLMPFEFCNTAASGIFFEPLFSRCPKGIALSWNIDWCSRTLGGFWNPVGSKTFLGCSNIFGPYKRVFIRKIRGQIWSRFFTQFWLLSLGSTPNPDQGDFCYPIPNVIRFWPIRLMPFKFCTTAASGIFFEPLISRCAKGIAVSFRIDWCSRTLGGFWNPAGSKTIFLGIQISLGLENAYL